MSYRGIVTKGIGGFYFVDTGDDVFRARGRGVLKRNKSLIIVGDEVEADKPLPGDDDGVITKIYPRKNSFSRPPVSNLDKMVVVFSVADPEPNLEVVDRLLVMAESKDIEPIVCINKSDLDEEKAKHLRSIYEGVYPTVTTSLVSTNYAASTDVTINETENENNYKNEIESLRHLIAGSRVALAGPSGVGKSSLTNALVPDADMETGEISGKTSRGKHTTRHVEILRFLSDGQIGYLYDTPGFTSFDLEGIGKDELGGFFPEISEASEGCRFRNCYHIKEPECNVRTLVEEGRISKFRYNSYLSALDEIREQNRRIYG